MRRELNDDYKYIDYSNKGIRYYQVKDSIIDEIDEVSDRYGTNGLYIIILFFIVESIIYYIVRQFIWKFILVFVVFFIFMVWITDVYFQRYKYKVLSLPSSDITQYDYYLAVKGAIDEDITYTNAGDEIVNFGVIVPTESSDYDQVTRLKKLDEYGADLEFIRSATSGDIELINDIAIMVGISKSNRIYPIYPYGKGHTDLSPWKFNTINKIEQYYDLGIEEEYDLVTDFGYIPIFQFESRMIAFSIHIKKKDEMYIYIFDPWQDGWYKDELEPEEYEVLPSFYF